MALVTGGCRGIGRKIACRLARDGATTVIHSGKSPADAYGTLSEIEEEGGRSFIFQTDFGAPASGAAALFAVFDREFGWELRR